MLDVGKVTGEALYNASTGGAGGKPSMVRNSQPGSVSVSVTKPVTLDARPEAGPSNKGYLASLLEESTTEVGLGGFRQNGRILGSFLEALVFQVIFKLIS